MASSCARCVSSGDEAAKKGWLSPTRRGLLTAGLLSNVFFDVGDATGALLATAMAGAWVTERSESEPLWRGARAVDGSSFGVASEKELRAEPLMLELVVLSARSLTNLANGQHCPVMSIKRMNRSLPQRYPHRECTSRPFFALQRDLSSHQRC